MKSAPTLLAAALAGLAPLGTAQSVVSKAEGFPAGVTDGDDACFRTQPHQSPPVTCDNYSLTFPGPFSAANEFPKNILQ
ncbi:hypothetical protein H9L39_19660 [Fusarium oxysporum f. sp. albedinis]|nr:hypothetical protein H9L39_19660 [Fusarium oxysporum f. sp. albedinis]